MPVKSSFPDLSPIPTKALLGKHPPQTKVKPSPPIAIQKNNEVRSQPRRYRPNSPVFDEGGVSANNMGRMPQKALKPPQQNHHRTYTTTPTSPIKNLPLRFQSSPVHQGNHLQPSQGFLVRLKSPLQPHTLSITRTPMNHHPPYQSFQVLQMTHPRLLRYSTTSLLQRYPSFQVRPMSLLLTLNLKLTKQRDHRHFQETPIQIMTFLLLPLLSIDYPVRQNSQGHLPS